MAALTVRGLDEGTRERLKAQAAAHGRSMEGEARMILAAAVAAPAAPRATGLGSSISALFSDEPAPAFVRSSEQAPAAELPE